MSGAAATGGDAHPGTATDFVASAGAPAPAVAQIAAIEALLASRGWQYDPTADETDVCFEYPPSYSEDCDDESHVCTTDIMIDMRTEPRHDGSYLVGGEVHIALVGWDLYASFQDAPHEGWRIPVSVLPAYLEAIESHRPGDMDPIRQWQVPRRR